MMSVLEVQGESEAYYSIIKSNNLHPIDQLHSNRNNHLIEYVMELKL